MDFLFPYMRNMCSIDILLNDKTSMDLFETQLSVQDIVEDVVSSRFKSKFELDLSNFCKDKGNLFCISSGFCRMIENFMIQQFNKISS